MIFPPCSMLPGLDAALISIQARRAHASLSAASLRPLPRFNTTLLFPAFIGTAALIR